MNKEIIKNQAQTIVQVFEKQTKHKMTNSCALEILSSLYGCKDYNLLANYIKPETAFNELSDYEKSQVEKSPGDSEYFNESVIISLNGRKLKSPSYPQECSYIRITDRADYEIAYWTSDEWVEEPQIVMGAILGAFNGSQGSPKLPQFAIEKDKKSIPSISQPMTSEEMKLIIEQKDGMCESIVLMDMDSFYDGIDAVNDLAQSIIVGDNTVEIDGETMRVSLTDISYKPVGIENGGILVQVNSILIAD